MTKHVRFPLLLLLLCISTRAISQDGSRTDSIGRTLGGDGMTLVRAAEFLALRPLHWEAPVWLTAGGIAVGTGLASTEDRNLQTLLGHNQSSANDRLADAVVVYGNGAYMFPVGAGLYLAGLFTGDRWLRETGLLATGAMFFSGVFSPAVKIGVGRARPYTGRSNYWFQPFRFFADDVHSFPSGHTVIAFSMSTVLSRRIGNIWASIVLYALAGSTAISRMYTSEHWFSDVVFGAASATAISNSLVSWYEGENHEGSGSFRILPYNGGVTLVLVF